MGISERVNPTSKQGVMFLVHKVHHRLLGFEPGTFYVASQYNTHSNVKHQNVLTITVVRFLCLGYLALC